MYSDKDPIVAISTAAGRGGIGIVRLSFEKEKSACVLEALFGHSDLTPRYAHLLPFADAEGELLDKCIVLFFQAPASYTGESVVEIQAHGGPVLMKLILRACLEKCAHLGLRLAEAGEFTKRAFLNGRMDLAQAEAVTDLIDAVSESAAHAASRSLSGVFSKKIEHLGDGVNELRAYVEAILDFPEEEIDHLSSGRIFERIDECLVELDEIFSKAHQGKVLNDGVSVALVGSPNVGKSSLLNALAGDDVAIVTEIAGTTRDRIEHWVTINGVPIKMIDTAGVRETVDIVEAKGIERTLQALGEADVVLHLVDASGEIPDDVQVLETVRRCVKKTVPVITVANKSDKAVRAGKLALEADCCFISARTGEGLDALKKQLLSVVNMQNSTDGLFMARERHLACLREARAHLSLASEMKGEFCMIELLAEELRLAGNALGEILGETTADDILGMIFSKFCIGK